MPNRNHSNAALARLLDSDHLTRTVPELAPEVLHHLILRHGLDACGDLVAAATSAQITSLFDLDLWQSATPGLDEKLDVARFGEWMEVLVDKDPSLAARTVATLDPSLAIAAMSRYIRVFDPATFERVVPTEEFDTDLAPDPFDGLVCEMSGYIVRARRTDSWDAVVLLLHALEDAQPACFDEVMRGCRRLSNDRAEIDGLDDLFEAPEQMLHDATLDREARREAQGYVTPADARAFLQMARRPHQPQPHEAQSSKRPAFVMDDQSTALIERAASDDDSNRTRMWRAMRKLGERAPDIFDERMHELAFLAGTLVAGCSLGDRPFTPREAHDAAIAICNIGLEQWPEASFGFDANVEVNANVHVNANVGAGASAAASMPEDFLASHGLVQVFEAGWATLHEQVSLFAADRLIATLRDLRCDDRDTRRGLIALERELMKHRAAGTPWRVRDKLDVLAILDMTAWTSLLGLFSECPVLPAALTAILTGDIRPIDPQAFELISTSDHIAQVRAFMTRLPDVLLR